ncbi:hypothetical protein RJ639_043463 [Escallonia herrerae]|uniref:Uncharacterized protein n=1 Tax=Escallonia herrerae TaxID=1293975 RepID=A0AA88WE77_9ASTE|nr:hypothetical protein RJ639_043463 [Escallonia herrerae]
MKMDVQILSRETIKPSSPTPHHLKTFKLSLFDQLAPVLYIPLSLFYPSKIGHQSPSQTLTGLKKSLAETLTRFYPLAGRIKDPISIDCNDEGVLFSEARVNCKLSKFLEEIDTGSLRKFLPCDTLFCFGNDFDTIVAVQVTIFDCGGVAIGTNMLHKLIDATTMCAFLKSWADTTAGSHNEVMYPDLTSASAIFPPRNPLPGELQSYFSDDNFFIEKHESRMRRFVFDATAIATLRAKAATGTVPDPTRIEALTAFIWKHFIAASKAINGHATSSMATHAVNLRRRMEPPLPNHCMGSLVWLATAMQDLSETEVELAELVETLRETLSNFDSESVNALKGDQGLALISSKAEEMGNMQHRKVKMNMYRFTSWCNMGLYNMDFGWGKPVWVGQMGDPEDKRSMQMIVFIERGDGIEAWMFSDEKEVCVLEKDPEFLAHASPNPLIRI